MAYNQPPFTAQEKR